MMEMWCREEVVWLPKFGKKRLMTLQRGEPALAKLGGWLNAYYFQNSQLDHWKSEVDAIGGILYQEVWTPVLEKLEELGIREGNELVWFHQGGSGVFPMHAAWKTENGRRRWLLEDYAIRYAPSVKSLKAASPVWGGSRLVIADPTRNLKFSDLECALLNRALGRAEVRILAGEQATKEAVLAGLRGSGIAHFSTHARFDIENPFGSGLILAHDQTLRLSKLAPLLKEEAPAFVVLSACETGMTRVTATPDEFLGFPAAFLEYGTRTVLATLWPVRDLAAALLVGRFYHEHYVGKKSVAQALRCAQNWVRTMTVRELSELLRDLRQEPAPAGPLAARVRSGLCGSDQNSCPFAEPYFWAAFTVSGQ
jgi:CHAT domain-containing protein